EDGIRDFHVTGVQTCALPIYSIEADGELMEAIAGESRLMPHLHLSLQAGDDMILKRMKRRHLRDDSIRFCAEVRALRPDIVFGRSEERRVGKGAGRRAGARGG